jgi:flagellar FliJ protein
MPPEFPLQVVLEYRDLLVDALEIEMSRLLSARQRAQGLLDALNEKLASLFNELRSSQTGDLDLVKIGQLRANIDYVDDYISRQEEEIAKLDQQIEAKREELIKARQDEEMLEVLKEKAIEAYEEDQKIKEGRAQDDIYITSHYQKSIKEDE